MKLQGDFPMLGLSSLFTFLLLVAVKAEEKVKVPFCGAHNATSEELYDLSSLSKKNGENYKIFVPANPALKEKNRTFEFNVCDPLTTTPAGIVAGDKVASYVIEEGEAKGISLGKSSGAPIIRDGSLVLVYNDGADCKVKNETVPRSTMIFFTCIDALVDRPPTFVGDFNSCNYVFEWKTQAACPVSDTSPSGGTILFRFFCMGIFFYLLIGILYNRFIKNAQGLEQIPNFKFWFGIYDFIKDMTLIIAVKIWDTLSSFRNKPSQYHSVPRSDMNSLSIDDDDDEL